MVLLLERADTHGSVIIELYTCGINVFRGSFLIPLLSAGRSAGNITIRAATIKSRLVGRSVLAILTNVMLQCKS